MRSQKKKIGDVGEEAAARYLRGKGYRIIERNYKKSWGEIDLVAEQRKVLVFCEVKARSIYRSAGFLPEQNVHAKKVARLRRICEMYLLERRRSLQQEWRIDVLSVFIDEVAKRAKIRHIENAVWELA